MIIAECATNWAEIHQAKEMIKRASQAGAAFAKFQLFDASGEKDHPDYQWLSTHELTCEQAYELYQCGKEEGIGVFFTVFHPKYVVWCEEIGVELYKIAYSERYNRLLQEVVLRTGKTSIISASHPNPNFLTLFCIPDYPADITGLEGIDFADSEGFEGFSDHTIGIDAARLATARGAKIIEKHFILERGELVPDAKWSMTPYDLEELVRWEKICQIE